jgi:hypothetical protein
MTILHRVAAGVALAGALLAPATASGQGTTAAVVLGLPTSPRSLGLAGAGAPVVADAWAAFLAPAQLGRVAGMSVAVSSESYLAGTQLSAGGLALPIGPGALGVGAALLDYGSVREIASSLPGGDGLETGRRVSASDQALVVGYGARLPWRGVRAGAAVEVVQTAIADLANGTAAAAFGVAWTSASGWDVSAGAQHLGPHLRIGATSSPLPATWRAGVAAPEVHLWGGAVRVMAEARHATAAGLSGAAAAEGRWTVRNGARVWLRGGYLVRASGDDHSPVTAGAGVGLGPFVLDYAFERFTEIGQVTHRVGIRFGRDASR